MAYKYVSKKFAGSLTKIRRELDKLKENGDGLKVGEEFDKPILPPMRPAVPPNGIHPAPADQSLPLEKEAGIRKANTKSKSIGSNKKNNRKQKR